MNIEIKPFSWNDNLSEVAIEDFQLIQKDLPYLTCQSIGMALAKLEILEKLLEAEPIKAIPLDRIKEVREEILDWDVNKVMDGCSEHFKLGVARGLDIASEILDKLIEIEG